MTCEGAKSESNRQRVPGDQRASEREYVSSVGIRYNGIR